VFKKVKIWATKLKRQLILLYASYKDPRVKWYVKIFVACVLAYAFSPIDLIPDFIPILGILDDIILVPFGIYLSLKMVPSDVIKDATLRVDTLKGKTKPKNWIAGGLIIFGWLFVGIWLVSLFLIN
jgi:uncharacterized membrane protein YkvA (DUF1232 family)